MNKPQPASHSCVPHPALRELIDTSGPAPEASLEPAPEELPGAEHRHADHVFVGTIITMDEALPQAEALAIKHGKIVAVGTENELQPHIGPLTKRIELGSQVLYPGLIEPHMHLWVTAINYEWLDCGPRANPSLNDVKAGLRKATKITKPGEWILGKLFDPSLYDGFPELTRAELDSIAPHNPVFIFNASMHFGYVNSAALQLAGIADNAVDPPGGHYGRASDGKLNGVLGEIGAISPMLKHINKIKPVGIIKNIHTITLDAARVGVTTMREAGTGALLGTKELTLLHALGEVGRLKTRLSIALFDDSAKDWPESEHTSPGAGNDLVWLSARKIVADGSNQGRSGYLHEPYLGTKERGALNLQPEELKQRIAWCHQHGWQIMIHANGDAATKLVSQAYHDVLGDQPHDQRHRIEHCSLVEDGVFEQMAASGVTPSFLINHVYYWGQTLRDNLLGPQRAKLLDRVASAKRAGLKFTLHSDYNVSPINPLHYVQVAATRMMSNGEVLNASEAVSVYDALRAITIDAAWQLQADDKLGSLVPGKHADLVILDADPQAVEPGKIGDIKVNQTWLAGKPTYQA